MSSTSGLSSNTSNPKPGNTMKFDAATRESIQAQSQARILAGIGGLKKDSFNSGGGLNPLKGLYSAAAATFLKNKQSQQNTGASEQKKGGFDASVTAVKKLATSTSSSTDSFQNTNSKVSGPASGVNYKKYEWNGKPGPTGSDMLEEAINVEESAPQGDINKVLDGLSRVIAENNGEFNDEGGGTSSFRVLDLEGSVTLDGNTISGYTKSDTGSFTFTIDEKGNATIDASSGDESSAEYEQLKGLLSGSLDGVRRKAATPAEPEPQPDPVGLTPEEQAAIDQAAADKAAADQAAADAAAAAKAAAAKAAADAAAAAAAAAAASGTAATGDYENGADLMKAFLAEINSRGGTSVNSNGDNKTMVSFRGMTGEVEQRSGEIKGKLKFSTGEVEFRVTLSGEITRFKTSGITLFKTTDIAALKDSLSKLNRTSVNVVA